MTGASLSKTQIDLLGDRLRQGSPIEPDLRMLDDYRRSFGPAYEFVVQLVRQQLALEPTGRPAKSTSAIVEKLHRETIRLSQVQDIAGCRIVVPDFPEQEKVVAALASAFPKSSVVDRRAAPTHGYRAVHVVVEALGRLVEIQVRTTLQHTWAEVSEKLSDVIDPAIKYGGGPDNIKDALKNGSTAVHSVENAHKVIAAVNARVQASDEGISEEAREVLADANTQLVAVRKQLDDALRKSVSTWVATEQRPQT